MALGYCRRRTGLGDAYTLRRKYRARSERVALQMPSKRWRMGQLERVRWMHGRRARLPLVTDESRLGRRKSE